MLGGSESEGGEGRKRLGEEREREEELVLEGSGEGDQKIERREGSRGGWNTEA